MPIAFRHVVHAKRIDRGGRTGSEQNAGCSRHTVLERHSDQAAVLRQIVQFLPVRSPSRFGASLGLFHAGRYPLLAVLRPAAIDDIHFISTQFLPRRVCDEFSIRRKVSMNLITRRFQKGLCSSFLCDGHLPQVVTVRGWNREENPAVVRGAVGECKACELELPRHPGACRPRSAGLPAGPSGFVSCIARSRRSDLI